MSVTCAAPPALPVATTTNCKGVATKCNGNVQFEFAEDDDEKTKTTMQVFQRFMLGIPVFDGSKDAYTLEARLKYRESSGKLTYWFELIRPDLVFKTAVQTELDLVKSALGFQIIQGFIGK